MLVLLRELVLRGAQLAGTQGHPMRCGLSSAYRVSLPAPLPCCGTAGSLQQRLRRWGHLMLDSSLQNCELSESLV